MKLTALLVKNLLTGPGNSLISSGVNVCVPNLRGSLLYGAMLNTVRLSSPGSAPASISWIVGHHFD